MGLFEDWLRIRVRPEKQLLGLVDWAVSHQDRPVLFQPAQPISCGSLLWQIHRKRLRVQSGYRCLLARCTAVVQLYSSPRCIAGAGNVPAQLGSAGKPCPGRPYLLDLLARVSSMLALGMYPLSSAQLVSPAQGDPTCWTRWRECQACPNGQSDEVCVASDAIRGSQGWQFTLYRPAFWLWVRRSL